MPLIRRIEAFRPLQARKRVAAYARVSVATERTHLSMSNQISYFSRLIQANPSWIYAGIYADEGITGTSTAKRDGFRRMMKAAEEGKIDIILTKSIQRFARNTVDLLQSIRHLKELGVEVRFEKEKISTMEGSGELLLTLLASFAQEEARSISQNIKWSLRKKNEKGIPGNEFAVYGYRWKDGGLVPDPEEAPVVRRIFRDYLAGAGLADIQKWLKAGGIRTRRGGIFRIPALKVILQNDLYTGDLRIQRYYVTDPITKKEVRNMGERQQYLVEDDHEAFVSREDFATVQQMMLRRKELGVQGNKSLNLSAFSGKLKCPYCGCSYIRKTRKNGRVYWVCNTTQVKGGRCSVGGSVPMVKLQQACLEILGHEEPDARLDYIEVPARCVLLFHMKDGSTREWSWDADQAKSEALKVMWRDHHDDIVRRRARCQGT